MGFTFWYACLLMVIIAIAVFIFEARRFKKYYSSLEEGQVAKVGMKVRVFSPDKKEDWGIGTITKICNLKIEGTNEILHNYPSEIKLEDGRITEGMECWWYPL